MVKIDNSSKEQNISMSLKVISNLQNATCVDVISCDSYWCGDCDGNGNCPEKLQSQK